MSTTSQNPEQHDVYQQALAWVVEQDEVDRCPTCLAVLPEDGHCPNWYLSPDAHEKGAEGR